jgi:hypothetical protein
VWQPVENCDGLHMLEGYWHLLLIIRYKHWRYQGSLLATSYIGMYTRSKKGIKMRMETTIGLYGKGNEIISLRLLCFEWPLLLHVLLLSKHASPNLYKLDQQWQHMPRFKNRLQWWQYPFVSVYGRGKGGKPFSIHELHFPTW